MKNIIKPLVNKIITSSAFKKIFGTPIKRLKNREDVVKRLTDRDTIVTKKLDDGSTESVIERRYLTADNCVVTMHYTRRTKPYTKEVVGADGEKSIINGETVLASSMNVTKEPKKCATLYGGFTGKRNESDCVFGYTRSRSMSNDPIRDKSVKHRRAFIENVPHLTVLNTATYSELNPHTKTVGHTMKVLPKSAYQRHGFAPNGSSLTI